LVENEGVLREEVGNYGFWGASHSRSDFLSQLNCQRHLPKLSQKLGQHKLQEAIEIALSNSCYDSAAVQHLLNAEELQHALCEANDVGALRAAPAGFVWLPTLAHTQGPLRLAACKSGSTAGYLFTL